MGGPRVLILIKGLGIGGAERLVVDSVTGDHERRYRYSVAYVLPWKDQLVADLESRSIPTVCIGGSRGSMLAAARWLVRHREDHDLVHAHLPATGVVARLFATKPVVYTEHNLAGSYRPPLVVANRFTYGRNAAVTAVSHAVADSLTGYPGPTPRVVLNGVSPARDLRSGEAVRAELGIAPDRPLLVHVGNIRPHKGHRTLIETAAALHSVSNALIVSIGAEKTAGNLQELTDRCNELGLDNLRFLGRREDARSFIAAADLFVNPSDVEGLPVAILEAMDAQTAVVATAVGGVPSVIRDGETGILVPPGDPAALVTAITSALEHPTDTGDLAERAKTLVHGEYSIARMTTQFEDIYDRVLA